MVKKLTDREIKQIISYYERGFSAPEIREKTGRSKRTIYKYINIHLKKELEFECPNNHNNTIKKGHIFRRKSKKFYPCEVCNCAYKREEVILK
jgi:predicted AAA+ superfamily ATPase